MFSDSLFLLALIVAGRCNLISLICDIKPSLQYVKIVNNKKLSNVVSLKRMKFFSEFNLNQREKDAWERQSESSQEDLRYAEGQQSQDGLQVDSTSWMHQTSSSSPCHWQLRLPVILQFLLFASIPKKKASERRATLQTSSNIFENGSPSSKSGVKEWINRYMIPTEKSSNLNATNLRRISSLSPTSVTERVDLKVAT